MKHLYIIGARGFGREVYNLFLECRSIHSEIEVVGFLDDKLSALDGYLNYPPIISSVEDYQIKEDDVFICALGDPKWKKHYSEMIINKGGKFISIIHPTAYVGLNTSIGIGCILCANVRISCDVKVGNYNTFQPFTVVGHDVTIGNYNHFNTYSFMGGFVDIRNEVTLHTGAIIHPHKKVLNGSIVGAGAVVIRNVKENSTVYGNPARILSY